MGRLLAILFWLALAAITTVAMATAATSELLAWRDPVYVVAGFAGVFTLTLLLFQPLLARSYLPGVSTRRAKRLHRWSGVCLVLCVVIHVAGLWITSPPDVIDALLFASPTPFSLWGVIAMWGIVATTVLVAHRFRSGVRFQIWRRLHQSVSAIVVACTVAHAMLIEGTMGLRSKTVLCLCIVVATLIAIMNTRQKQQPGA